MWNLKNAKMFTSIRTSEKNKAVVSKLTRKLNLGAENIIARIALSYSLSLDEKLDLKDLEDSKGKEYSRNVLFGDQLEIYAGLVALKYKIQLEDINLARYIKLHLDHGLDALEVSFDRQNINIFEYFENEIQQILI